LGSLEHEPRRLPVEPGEFDGRILVGIGDDILVGANAIILKGVAIGDRSVIGAGAVVSLKHIPPDSLVGGNPAQIIRSLPVDK